MSILTEPARDLSVVSKYDLIVVGGGIAGVSAALAAARGGAKVCLIEKACGLGGLATLGNVIVYLPICDGEGHQVIGGIGEEMLQLSAKCNGEVPEVWRTPHSPKVRSGTRFEVRFSAPDYMLALEKLLVDAGVDIWYDTLFSQVVIADMAITTVVVQNKSGRLALNTKFVVDASGDADVCAASGEETVSLDTNVLSNWFYYEDNEGTHLVGMTEGFTDDGSPSPKAQHGYRGDNGKDVSEHVINAHSMVLDKLVEIQKKHPEAHLSNVPMMPSMRMTRRLAGKTTMNESIAGTTPDDLVGLCPNWRKAGIVYGVPLGALHGKIRNLLAAGRCISAEGRLWDMTRVIPICALTGEVAGTAAGMCVRSGLEDVGSVSVSELQERLISNGNMLDAGLIRGV